MLTSHEYKTQESFNNPLLKHIPSRNDIFHPRSMDEVKTLINFAKSKKILIRTLGSEHSTPSAIYDTTNVPQIKLILAGEFRKIKSIHPDESKEHAMVSVGAGCYLGINPEDKDSTKENSFNYQVNAKGYALPNLGGISHQTIAGFLQTSSSGGSAKHGIADVVEAIEWINGKGELCHAKKGEEALDAVAVSMGLFGIITNVTFRLPKNYLVAGMEYNREMKDSFLVKDEKGHYTKLYNALFKDNDYIHINWLPQKGVERTMEWIGKKVDDTSLPLKPYQHTLSSTLMSSLAAIAFFIGNIADKIGTERAQKKKAEMLKLFCDPEEKQEFCDWWLYSLPIDDQADVDGLIRTSFSELWFPKNKLNEVMQKLEELFATHPEAAGNFIVELYCAKKSPFWLSPSNGDDAFRVDLYWWEHNLGNSNEYFGLFWEKLLSVEGARLHWGKILPIPGQKYGNVSFVVNGLSFKDNYPKLNEWLKLREAMDPEQLFVTDAWRRIFNIPFKLEYIKTLEEKSVPSESKPPEVNAKNTINDSTLTKVLKYFGVFTTAASQHPAAITENQTKPKY